MASCRSRSSELIPRLVRLEQTFGLAAATPNMFERIAASEAAANNAGI